jgi:ketosteroid isomerase-like protein
MTRTPEIVARFFNAMQRGKAAEADMAALFAEDAVYVEPFSGAPQIHMGLDAILATMRGGWDFNPPDMRIEVESASVDGTEISVDWTCISSALPGGRGSGTNRFSVIDGVIMRLETILRMPK